MYELEKNIILVTNREPYIHEKKNNTIHEKRAIGGVVTALDPLMKKNGGTWIAWGSGSADFNISENSKITVPMDEKKYTLKRIHLTKKEEELYYEGYANRVLWPLFHIFIDKITIDDSFWNMYKKVNHKFAQSIVEEVHEDTDLIWIHDYHLALVPEIIKNEIPTAKIGFFWHIPWPPWEIFGSLPQRDEILTGLLYADIIGFHTKSYVNNFLNCCKRKISTTVQNNIVQISERQKTKVVSSPLGINYNSYAQYEETNKKAINKKKRKFLDIHQNGTIILGIDRLDYTKGILNRLKAYEYFLEQNIEFRGKVTLIQIATPSRYQIDEYHDMKKNIDETVGRINAKFRSVEWTPVEYFYRRIPQDELIMYYQLSDVALLTPIRDGMNLIAKEYIAARQKPGVLILSEFAGASEELHDAIIVNPYDLTSTAEAIKTAITMPLIEKENRFHELKQIVENHDDAWWLEDFLKKWNERYQSDLSQDFMKLSLST